LLALVADRGRFRNDYPFVKSGYASGLLGRDLLTRLGGNGGLSRGDTPRQPAPEPGIHGCVGQAGLPPTDSVRVLPGWRF